MKPYNLYVKWKIWKSDEGTFTLESTLLFPMLMIIMITIMLYGIIQFQKATLYAHSLLVSEKTAFIWDNSNKQIEDGSFHPTDYDPLYWRIFDSQTMEKLQKGEQLKFGSLEMQGSFSAAPWNRKVTMTASHLTRIPLLFNHLLQSETTSVSVEALAVEPAEFIRVTDWLLNIVPILRQTTSHDKWLNAIELFRNREKTNPDIAFRNHDEAKRYLQQLVRGREMRIATESVGHWRLIDAFDPNGIAHQAYFGKKIWNKDIQEQLAKDHELLATGKLQKIVWHFFKNANTGELGADAELLMELQKIGIEIRIHGEEGVSQY